MGNGETTTNYPISNAPKIESENDKLGKIVNTIVKQGGNKIFAGPVLQNESEELYKRGDSMCLINFETNSNGITMNNGFGNGFFCKLNKSYIPFQKALFTNNHILNEENLKVGKKIKINYQAKDISIEITEKRNVFTDKTLDYTCVEIFEEDGINNFFEIDEDVINNKMLLKDQEIFILQYCQNSSIGFSSGKILHITDNKILHSAVTENGSSGSPLIRRRRTEIKFVVGIHFGALEGHKYGNLATPLDNILEDLKLKIIESSKIKIIAHIAIPEDNYEARIINSSENAEREEDLKLDFSKIVKNEKEIKSCMIFIDGDIIDFTYKHPFKKKGNYEIIYIFHNLIDSTNFMFYRCDLLDLDLTNFNTENVTNMSWMFCRCESLKKLILANLKTEKVTDMSWMFNQCILLKELDLSSFKTSNVKDMSQMFNRCESLVNLKISTFDTKQVTSMLFMFWGCLSLKTLNLSNFNTEKVENMQGMFSRCHNLKELNVSNFKTENVTIMLEMFNDCPNLEVLNLSNFDTKNCKNMLGMFADCESLVKVDLSNFNTQNTEKYPWLFAGCKKLKKDNVITTDKKIKNNFK